MNSKQFLKEGFLEDAQEAHSDHEVQMARVDCYYAAEHAIVLHKLLRNISEEQGLEGWVASKITLANDYLKSVREHLEYQMMNVDAGEDDFLPLAEGLKPVKKNSVVESTAPGAEDEEEKFQDFERGPWYVILKGKAISVNGVPKKFNWLNGAKTYFRSMMDKNPEMAQKIKREYDEASDKKSVIYYTKNLPADNTTSTEQPVSEGEKPGLWANIRAKRKRIKGGSGERMRKPGSKGAPSDADIKSIRAASESVVKESDFHSQFAAMIDDMKKSGKLKTGDPTKSQAKYAPEQSREELTARLRELESKFDPEYQYSDDYSFWTKQNAIAREIASIKKKLGSQGVAEDNEQKYRVTYDMYFTNREKPLYTKTYTVRASSEEEAIKIIQDLIGGRNHRIEKDVAEGSESDLVYISTDRVEAFENWMESEGLETDVPKRDEGTYVVYDYSDANHTSKMYADEWNEKKGVAEGYEGDDRGDYHSTARAANQASRTAKSKEDHKKAADLHSKAATYGLSAGQDQSVIRDHQMAASEHHRASKKLKEKSQDVAEGWEDEFRARQAAEKAAKSAQEKEYRQYGITARKSGGDDAYSWAVFINGHMMVNGLSKREVLYYKKIALEKAKEKQGVAEGLPGSSQIYDQIESLREKLNSTSDPDERRFYIKKIKNLEHKLHSTDDPFDIDDPAPIGRQGVAEGYKNTYNVGDRVDGPLGTGTIVAVSKNVNVDGRVRVKLDDPSKAGEDGKYKDSFVLTTTQLKHISEQGVAEGSDQNYQVGDQVLTQVGGRWIPAVITKPINAAGNYGVKFKVGSKVMNYVSSPDQLKKQRVAEGSVSTISKCASLAAKYFNSAGLQQQYDIDEYIKANSEQGVAEGSEIKIPTEDGIGWQDIRLLAGEGKLTQKTIKQAIEIIRKQRKQKQGVAEGSDNSVEALIQIYNNRDQKIVKTKVFRSEDEANRWADRNNATILKLKDVAKKSTLDETSAGSIAGVVNPKIKNKSKVGTLFGGTYKQQKDK